MKDNEVKMFFFFSHIIMKTTYIGRAPKKSKQPFFSCGKYSPTKKTVVLVIEYELNMIAVDYIFPKIYYIPWSWYIMSGSSDTNRLKKV